MQVPATRPCSARATAGYPLPSQDTATYKIFNLRRTQRQKKTVNKSLAYESSRSNGLLTKSWAEDLGVNYQKSLAKHLPSKLLFGILQLRLSIVWWDLGHFKLSWQAFSLRHQIA